MYSKLAFGNVKKSMKDFTVYFLTLTFGVCLFYVFNSIGSQEAMLKINESQKSIIEMLQMAISSLSVFIAVILGFLVIYANRFLIKRRKKELGLYLCLGMDKRQVSKVLIIDVVHWSVCTGSRTFGRSIFISGTGCGNCKNVYGRDEGIYFCIFRRSIYKDDHLFCSYFSDCYDL